MSSHDEDYKETIGVAASYMDKSSPIRLHSSSPSDSFDESSNIFLGNTTDTSTTRKRKRKAQAPKNLSRDFRENVDEMPLDLSKSQIYDFANEDDEDDDERRDEDDDDDDVAKRLKSCFTDEENEEDDDLVDRESSVSTEDSEDSNKIKLPSFLQSSLHNLCDNKNLHSTKDSSDPNSLELSLMRYSAGVSGDLKRDFGGSLLDFNKISPNKDSVSNSSNYDVHEESIRRFSSFEECKEDICQKDLVKDHFHCLQCKKTIIRREEVIRHSKWHKKREESLHFNFMRFSPSDDCKDYTMCSYNGRQTHYHCLHPGCLKIYISTSDVQMHANFHKKDAAINQEGFQRYRATEVCGMSFCQYSDQRTTHFHCMRSSCQFTFKNKADMDKHKSHHQKNDLLSKEGFKKFIKYEHCDFASCKFSKVMNHIHCIRDNCDYVVHSSAQINSHRRKHDRRLINDNAPSTANFPCYPSMTSTMPNMRPVLSTMLQGSVSEQPPKLSPIKTDFTSILNLSKGNIDSNNANDQLFAQISEHLTNWDQNYDWKHDFSLYNDDEDKTAETRRICQEETCLYKSVSHYHCTACSQNCNFVLKSSKHIVTHILRAHQRKHKLDNLLLDIVYRKCTNSICDKPQHTKPHIHCNWHSCSFLQPIPSDYLVNNQFLLSIYDHYKMHDSRLRNLIPINDDITDRDSNPTNQTNERKRGRPPKYKKNIHIPRYDMNDCDIVDDESISELTILDFINSPNCIKCGFKYYPTNNTCCVDELCIFYGRREHFHCLRSRCYHATDNLVTVNLHRREFHHYMQIEDGYEYFDTSINCRRTQCQNNRVNNHYHCVRSNCDYSFKRFNTMHQHTKKHIEIENQKSGLSTNNSSNKNNAVSTFHSLNNPRFQNNNGSTNNHSNNNFKMLNPFNVPNNSCTSSSTNNPLLHNLTQNSHIKNSSLFRNYLQSQTYKHQYPSHHPPQLSPNFHQQPPYPIPPNPFLNFSNSFFAIQNTLKTLMSQPSSINTSPDSNMMNSYLENFLKLAADHKAATPK